jgi:hypothetical protein
MTGCAIGAHDGSSARCSVLNLSVTLPAAGEPQPRRPRFGRLSQNAQYGTSGEAFPSGQLFLYGSAGFDPNPDPAASRTCFRCLTEANGRSYRFCCFPNRRVLSELKLPFQAVIAEQFSPVPAQKIYDPAV